MRLSYPSGVRARVLTLVLLALAPVVVLLVFAHLEQRRDGTALARENALRLARVSAANEARLIEGARQLLIALSHSREVSGGDRAACEAFFARLRTLYEGYVNFGVVDAAGDWTCSGTPLERPISLADRAYFQRAIESRSFAVGDYQLGRVTGKATLNFAYPWLDERGAPQGVVFAALDLQWLGRVAAEAKLPSGATLTVLDRNGTILVRDPDPERYVGQAAAGTALVQRILGAAEGTTEVTGLDGVPRIYGFAPVRRDGQPAIYVAIGMSKAAAFAPADRLLRRNLALLGAVMILALAAAWAGADVLIVRRVRALAVAADRLRAGDLQARAGLAAHGADELSDLARTFDTMAVALEEREVKLRDAERHAAEARLASVLDIAADAIFTVDEAERIVLFNRGAERMFGVAAAEVVGQSFERLVSAEAAAAIRERIRDTAAGAAGPPCEVAARRWNGEHFPADVSVSRVSTSGEPVHTVILRDISARRRAEEERDRYFDMSLDLLSVAGFDGYFKRVNASWQKTLGWTREDLLAGPYLDLVHPDDVERTIHEASRLTSGEVTITFENRYRCKDGSYRWIEWTAVPDLERQVIYASSRDVTERKRAEEQIQALNSALAARMAELSALNQELEAFSYSVSHDLRAPLRHVTGFAELLRRKLPASLDDTGRRYVTTIVDAATRMGRLIDDLLAFSRMGHVEMLRTSVDLERTIDEVRQELAGECAGREIAWTVHPLPRVQGDPSMLRLVMQNLLSNAIKYTRTRDRAEIVVGAAGDPSAETVVWVGDNGVGFDPQYAHKLFGVFQRLHGADEFDGTGIGLANVRRIIHRHGGRTWAVGAPDRGATFYFSLPTSQGGPQP